MRDFKINILKDYGFDIDIIDGQAEYLSYESQTSDQRAALCVYTVKGTVPGLLDYGVSWTEEFTNENTVSQLNNEVQQQLNTYAGAGQGSYMTTSSMYQGIMVKQDGQIGVLVTRG